MRLEDYVDPAELRRLISTLVVLVGALIIFALFAMIVVPGIRNANGPSIQMVSTLLPGETGWLDPVEFHPRKAYKDEPVDPATIMTASPALIDAGKGLFEKNCAACHGSEGRGDGPGGKSTPPPRDFTKAEGWKNGDGLPAIYKTLQEGIKGSSMASFANLAPRERMALAHYVRTFGKYPRKDDPAAAEALAKELAGAALFHPNRIPASLAMKFLMGEYAEPAPLAAPDAGDGSPGAAAFRRAVADAARAARTLAASPAWRGGPGDLASIVTAGAPANGFSPAAALMTAGEWGALHGELTRRMPR